LFLFRKPSDTEIRTFLATQERLPFSYPEVGASRGGAPPGYPINHHRGRLGAGLETYTRAIDAIRGWNMYDLPWTRLCWPDAPIRVGETVVVLARHAGFWSLNPSRIIYLIDEEGPIRRYGFAFGTLPGHAERGEERFTVEWRRTDDSVWYEVFAFAGPHHLLAKVGYPVMRLIQKRFAAHSAQAMRRAVAGEQL
jgi:uncharacterized protein (UPF0548 family)